MAEEVRQDLSGRGYAFFGRPPEPTKLQAFTAWLLVYGVYFTLYALSYAFVFRGPFADFEVNWLGWVFNYLIVGSLWGVTLFPRMLARSHLHLIGLKIKRSPWAIGYKHYKFDFSELAFFGPRVGVIVTVFFIAYLTFIFAVSWPIAVIIEIAIWADRSDR